MKPLKDGIRSLVRIDFQGNVHKYFRGTDADKRCQREVLALQTLAQRGCDFVPILIEYDYEKNYLCTTNCGSPAPHVSRKKADSLFEILETKYGVRHDDAEPRNITYDDKAGKFCVIDFELCTILEAPSKVQNELKNETPDNPHSD